MTMSISDIFQGIDFFKNRREEKQQKKLAIEDSKKAEISTSYVYIGGKGILTIHNIGQSNANNVKLSYPEKSTIFLLSPDISKTPFSYINFGESADVTLHLIDGERTPIELVITWDDDFAIGREYKKMQTL